MAGKGQPQGKLAFPEKSAVGPHAMAASRLSALFIVINIQPDDVILHVEIDGIVRPVAVKTGDMFVGGRDLIHSHSFYMHKSSYIYIVLMPSDSDDA